MIREKLYRDPVHDLISLDKNSREDRCIMQLIDTPQMQRLRRIRQLGLASLSFQGAEHSRFTHSLGVMWIATRILGQLAKEWPISQMQATAVRCAALLHDVGHGPFSHIFEVFLGMSHETWTRRIILSAGSEVHRVLRAFSPDLPRKVAGIIEGQGTPPFLSQIISSQLDADRFDYLLRDSAMTGVKYGVFDFERLLKVLRLDPRGKRIVVSQNGIHPVEKYLQARYHMYSQVYQHKTVRAAETMLALTLRRATEVSGESAQESLASNRCLARLLTKGDRIPLPDYLGLTDEVVLGALDDWRTATDPVLRDLATRLLERRLFKTIDVSQVRGLKAKLGAAKAEISRLGVDPRYYLALDESGSVAYRPYDSSGVESGRHIMVEAKAFPGAYADIHDLSEVVAGLSRAACTTRRIAFPEKLSGTNLRERMTRIFLG
jgi:hypothetical protein